MPTNSRILTAGGIILDSVIAVDGRTSIEQMGGNAVYSAVGAALWSRNVAIAGNVPANYPEAFLGAMGVAGIIRTGIVRRDDVVDEAEWFLHEADGSRQDHIYGPRRLFCAAGLGPGPVDPTQRARFAALLRSRTPEGMTFGGFRAKYPVTIEQALAAGTDVRMVHLAPERPDVLAALARTFRARGAIVSLDPGYVAVREPSEKVEAILSDIDIFLPSERELSVLRPGVAFPEALRQLAACVRLVVGVKLGSRGALILERSSGRMLHVPAVPVTAVDPVGAGDAFCGGFAACYLASGDAFEAALCGTVSASLVVEGFGALHALGTDPSKVESRLRQVRSTIGAENIQ